MNERAGSDRRARRSSRVTAAPRVLVVYKKSALQTHVRERKNARLIELLAQGDRTVERMQEAHDDHVGTIEEAREALEALGARATFRYRGDEGLVEDTDLVVTIGGDGTLLWAARWIGPGVPAIAINSAPGDSVGYFCAGAKGAVREVLRSALAGELREVRLTRMEVSLDGEVVSRRVLNDVLFAHASPAGTSRYILRHERADGSAIEEEQKSSGIWIGPAAGSTAAQLSAGGRVLPAQSKRIQYVVREPYLPPDESYQLVRGLVDPDERLVILSKVREGTLFVDGSHQRHDVRWGTRVTCRRSEESLTILGFPR